MKTTLKLLALTICVSGSIISQAGATSLVTQERFRQENIAYFEKNGKISSQTSSSASSNSAVQNANYQFTGDAMDRDVAKNKAYWGAAASSKVQYGRSPEELALLPVAHR